MPDDTLKALYDNIIGTGKVSPAQLGDFNTFGKFMSDSTNVRTFYDNIVGGGIVAQKDMGNFDTFYQHIQSGLQPKFDYVGSIGKIDSLMTAKAAEIEPLIPAHQAAQVARLGEYEPQPALMGAGGMRPTSVSGFAGLFTGNKEQPKLDEADQMDEPYQQKMKEYTYLQNAKDLTKLAADFTKNQDDGSFKQFLNGLTSPLAKDFFTAGSTETLRQADIAKVAQKAGDGQELSDDEKAMLSAYGIYQQAMSKPGALPYTVGQQIAMQVPYMVQFALTSPIGSAAEDGVNALIGVTKQNLPKLLKDEGYKAVLRQVGKELPGIAVKGAVQTPLMPMTYTIMGQKLAGEVDAEGNVTNQPTLSEGIWKGLANAYPEILTESMGAHIMGSTGAIGKMLGQKIPKGLTKLLSPVEKFRKAAAFSSFPEEFSEEMLNNVLTPLLDPDTKFSDVWTGQNILTTALTIAAVGGGFYATNQAYKAIDETALRSQHLSGLPKDVRTQVIGALKSDKPEEVSSKLSDIMSKSGLSVPQGQQILDYAWKSSMKKGMSESLFEQSKEIQKRQIEKSMTDQIAPFVYKDGETLFQVLDNEGNVFWVKDGEINVNQQDHSWAIGKKPLIVVPMEGGQPKMMPITDVNSVRTSKVTDKINEAITSFDQQAELTKTVTEAAQIVDTEKAESATPDLITGDLVNYDGREAMVNSVSGNGIDITYSDNGQPDVVPADKFESLRKLQPPSGIIQGETTPAIPEQVQSTAQKTEFAATIKGKEVKVPFVAQSDGSLTSEATFSKRSDADKMAKVLGDEYDNTEFVPTNTAEGVAARNNFVITAKPKTNEQVKEETKQEGKESAEPKPEEPQPEEEVAPEIPEQPEIYPNAEPIVASNQAEVVSPPAIPTAETQPAVKQVLPSGEPDKPWAIPQSEIDKIPTTPSGKEYLGEGQNPIQSEFIKWGQRIFGNDFQETKLSTYTTGEPYFVKHGNELSISDYVRARETFIAILNDKTKQKKENNKQFLINNAKNFPDEIQEFINSGKKLPPELGQDVQPDVQPTPEADQPQATGTPPVAAAPKVEQQSRESAQQESRVKPQPEHGQKHRQDVYVGDLLKKEPWEMTREKFVGEGYTFDQTDRSLTMELNKWQKIKNEANKEKYNIPAVNEAIARVNRKIELANQHRESIKQALSEGKPVPENVLAEYPDLKVRPEKPATKLRQQPENTADNLKDVANRANIYDKFTQDLGLTESFDAIPGDAMTGKIGAADIVVAKDGARVRLESIKVPLQQRDKGQANAAMKALTDKADELGLDITLQAVPEVSSDMSAQQLRDWYRKFDFIFVGNKGLRVANEGKGQDIGQSVPNEPVSVSPQKAVESETPITVTPVTEKDEFAGDKLEKPEPIKRQQKAVAAEKKAEPGAVDLDQKYKKKPKRAIPTRWAEVLKREPESFEESVLQFLLAGGRFKTQDFKDHSGFKEGSKELATARLAFLSEKGINMDQYADSHNTFGLDNQGEMAIINAITDIIKDNNGKWSVAKRLEHLQGINAADQIDLIDPELIAQDEAGMMDEPQVQEEVRSLMERLPDMLARLIEDKEFSISDVTSVDDLINFVEDNSDEFSPQGFPYSPEDKVEILKFLNDEKRTGSNETEAGQKISSDQAGEKAPEETTPKQREVARITADYDKQIEDLTQTLVTSTELTTRQNAALKSANVKINLFGQRGEEGQKGEEDMFAGDGFGTDAKAIRDKVTKEVQSENRKIADQIEQLKKDKRAEIDLAERQNEIRFQLQGDERYTHEGDVAHYNSDLFTDDDWHNINIQLTRAGFSPRPDSEWKTYFSRDSWNGVLNNGAHIAAFDKVFGTTDQSIHPTADERKVITEAKRHFGTTDNLQEAGYVTPDGVMLDFSGVKQGGSYGVRAMDHREVNQLKGIKGDYTDAMREFMAMGNIRLQSYGFDLTQPPTKQQQDILRQLIGRLDGDVTIDFSNRDGHTEHSVEYSGASAAKVFADINRYYKEGINPISNIRFQLQPQTNPLLSKETEFMGDVVFGKPYQDFLKFHDSLTEMAKRVADNTGTKIIVVKTSADLPRDIMDSVTRKNKQGNYVPALWTEKKGQREVYLISNQNTSTDAAAKALLHEVVGHNGLRNLLGTEYDNLLKQVWAQMPEEDKIRISGAYKSTDRLLIADEWLANQAEILGDKTPSIVRYAISKIRQLIRDLFGVNLKFTDSDLKALFTDSRKALQNQTKTGQFAGDVILRHSMTLYHGTPHDFDKFSSDKIGTGEGAQAYGYGLYFTDLKDVAKHYATNVTDSLIPIRDTFEVNGFKYYGERAQAYKEDLSIKDSQKRFAKRQGISDSAYREAYTAKNKARTLITATIHKGKDADQYDYLRWDKPVTLEQLKKINAEFNKSTGHDFWSEKIFDSLKNDPTRDFSGSLVYSQLSVQFSKEMLGDKFPEWMQGNKYNDDRAASAFLLRAGIDGIKYPAESRGESARGFNYVVFDENAIEIEDKLRFQIIGETGAERLVNARLQTNNLLNLTTAKTLSEQDMSPDKILLMTGWQIGKDGKWKMELDDNKTKIVIPMAKIIKLVDKHSNFTPAIPLGDVIENKELFTAYPELKEYKVVFYEYDPSDRNRSTIGFTNSDNRIIGIGIGDLLPARAFSDNRIIGIGIGDLLPARALRYTNDSQANQRIDKAELHSGFTIKYPLIHELQHIAQRIEGFAPGGNQETVWGYYYDNLQQSLSERDWYKKLNDQAKRRYIDTVLMVRAGARSVDEAKRLLYHQMAGETEARNTQTRIGLKQSERLIKSLQSTEDVARKDQVILDQGLSDALQLQIIGEQGAQRLTEAGLAVDSITNLDIAREMETAGKTEKEIWLATGWQKGKDGKWRMEIPDFKLKVKVSDKTGKLNAVMDLNQVIDAPELFKAYPALNDIITFVDINSMNENIGSFTPYNDTKFDVPDEIKVFARNVKAAKSVLAHEVQHAIQHASGFATGGSPVLFSDAMGSIKREYQSTYHNYVGHREALEKGEPYNGRAGKYNWQYDNMMFDKADLEQRVKDYEQRINELKDVSKAQWLSPDEAYKRLAGEVEARNAQTRLTYDEAKRASDMLSESEDVAREDQIVLMDKVRNALDLTPETPQTETEAFRNWFGSSRVVDENGEPLRVYSGHSNVELYGSKFNPKKATAGGFYASEAPEVASGYALSKFGSKEGYEHGSQYRLKGKNGEFNKKIWQYELSEGQKKKLDELIQMKDENDENVFDIAWMRSWANDNKNYDPLARRIVYQPYSLQNIYEWNEQMGYNIAYLADKTDQNEPEYMRQRKNQTEEIMDALGIQWSSYDWMIPGVMPVYLKIANPLDADKPFPADLMQALKDRAKGEREKPWEVVHYTTWTKDYPLKEFIKDVESGSDSWTTQVPTKALEVFRAFGYDGIKERGAKGQDLPREQKWINWIAFDPTQVKSATGNIGTFSPDNPDIRFSLQLDNEGLIFDTPNGEIANDIINVNKRLQTGQVGKGDLSYYTDSTTLDAADKKTYDLIVNVYRPIIDKIQKLYSTNGITLYRAQVENPKTEGWSKDRGNTLSFTTRKEFAKYWQKELDGLYPSEPSRIVEIYVPFDNILIPKISMGQYEFIVANTGVVRDELNNQMGNPDIRFSLQPPPADIAEPYEPDELKPRDMFATDSKFETKFNHAVENVFDNQLTVKFVEDEVARRGGKFNANSHPYRDENSARSAAQAEKEKFDNHIVAPYEQVLADIQKLTGKELSYRDIWIYQVAKHARERNRDLGGATGVASGSIDGNKLTDATADWYVSNFEEAITKYDGGQELLQKLWDARKKVTKFTLDHYVNDGLISREVYDKLTNPETGWQWYVPYRGWKDNINGQFDYQVGDIGDAYNPFKKADGRISESDDPTIYMIAMGHTAILAGAKNAYKNQMANLILLNPDIADARDLFWFKKVYRVLDADGNIMDEMPQDDLKGMFIEKLDNGKIAVIGSGVKGLHAKFKQLGGKWDFGRRGYQFPANTEESLRMEYPIKPGTVTTKVTDIHETRKPIYLAKQHEVDVFKNGERGIMVFADPKVAHALNRHNAIWENGAIALQRVAGVPLRFMAQVLTSKNPAFWPVNMTRDIGYAWAWHAINSEQDATAFLGNIPMAIKATHRYLKGEVHHLKPHLIENLNDVDKMYLRWKEGGGETSYFRLLNVDKLRANVEHDMKVLMGELSTMGKFNENVIQKAGEWLSIYSQLSENISRFATYMTSYQQYRKRGVDDLEAHKRAISDSKNVTVNFDKYGRVTPLLKSMYLFIGPNLGGLYNISKLANQNRAAFAKGTAAFLTLGLLSSELTRLLSPPDDDDPTQREYDTLNDFIKQNYLVLPNPAWWFGDSQNERFITIPMPQGFRALYGGGVIAGDIIHGKKTIGQGLTSFSAGLFDAFMPVSMNFTAMGESGVTGTRMARPIIPDVVKPFYDAFVTKEDFAGRAIFREPFTPALHQRLPEFTEANSYNNPYLVLGSKYLNRLGGGDDLRTAKYVFDKEGKIVRESSIRGIFDVNPARIEYLIESYTGGVGTELNNFVKTTTSAIQKLTGDEEAVVDPRNIPIFRRFYRTASGQSAFRQWSELKNEVDTHFAFMGAYKKAGEYDQYRTLRTNTYMQGMKKLIDNVEDKTKRIEEVIDWKKQNEQSVKEYYDKMEEMYRKALIKAKELKPTE